MKIILNLQADFIKGSDKNVAGTHNNLVDMGLKLGRHENSEHIFSADIVCDVAIFNGRIDFIGGCLLEKNSTARSKIFAVDNFDGNFATHIKQRRRTNRYAIGKRGHGGTFELHCAAVDGNSGALYIGRTPNKIKMRRNFYGIARHVCFDGLAGCRRFERGVYNSFGRNVRGVVQYFYQDEAE